MAVKTMLFRVPLPRWRKLLGSRDGEAARRLEDAWFAARGSVADAERVPDRALISGLIDRGVLYEELDDETSLRLDRLVILAMERELQATAEAFAPMRDDLQLLVRALRSGGKAAGIVPLLDHMANGRRFGASEIPIDVPHYGFLDAAEVAQLADWIEEAVKAARPKGLLGRLTGGGPKLAPAHVELLEGLGAVLEAVRREGLDLFSVNRDPEARWDVA